MPMRSSGSRAKRDAAAHAGGGELTGAEAALSSPSPPLGLQPLYRCNLGTFLPLSTKRKILFTFFLVEMRFTLSRQSTFFCM